MNYPYPDHVVPLRGRPARFLSTASCLFASAMLAILTPPARAASIHGTTDDRQVSSSGSVTDVNPMQSGYSNATVLNPVVVFQLPTLPAGKEFSDASLKLYLQGRDGTPSFNADLYGIGVSASASVLSTHWYAGALDAGAILIQDNFLTPANTSGPFTTSAPDLTDFLNAAYAKGAGAGQYVFFRLNPDVAGLAGNYTRYRIYSAEYSGGANYWPKLDYSTADIQPAWSTVPLGGGGKVTGFIASPAGDVYIRTDVGGAYRWSPGTGGWVHITDTLVTLAQANAFRLIGTASLAVDPADNNRLYVAVGDSHTNGIFTSGDKGVTWTHINPSTPILMDSNTKPSNVAGERLAVDPNNANIVWFGSSRSGLYKGVNSAGTWTWTQISSSLVPFGAEASGKNIGVSFVVCDKNGSSTIVYAGVYDNVGTTGGIYRSTNGGTTWDKVGGAALTMPMRARVSAGGTLYITQANIATAAGMVGKLVRNGTIASITPNSARRYSGVDVRTVSGNDIVFVAEYDSSNAAWGEMWRSANGGANWSPVQHQNFNGGAPWTRAEPDGTLSVNKSWFAATSDILIDPSDINTLWACDIYGVSRTQDAQNLGTTGGAFWNSLEKGLEETVVMAIKNAPTGAPLLTGVADVGGYLYADTTQRPVGAGGQAMTNPLGGNRTSLDFSEGYPGLWAGAWVNSAASAGSGAISLDGGTNWLVFGQVARKVVTNSAAAGVETWDVGHYLAGQKAKGINQVTLALCAQRTDTTHQLAFNSREAGSGQPRLWVNGATSLTAVADTYVAAGGATTNYGATTPLVMSNNNNAAAHKRWIYLRFDLSSVGAITSAELRLDRVASANTTSFETGVYASTNLTWVEGNGGSDNSPSGEITWNNRPVLLASKDSIAYADPITNPKYYDGATKLQGGRVAVSAVDPDNLVWLPEVEGNAARYSTDRGVTWTASTGGATSMMKDRFYPSELIQQLASDRVNGNFYLAKFNEGGGGRHYVYQSTNGGATFSYVGTASGGSSNVYRCQLVAAPPTSPYPSGGDVWLSDDGVTSPTAGGLWRSTDGGATWGTKLSNVRAVRQVTFGKASSGSGYTVFINGYVGGVLGVYRSDDYGSTWSKLPDVPSIASVTVLAGDRQNHGKVFIGYNGRGVFELR